MKCSFCEQTLICKACSRPFHPRSHLVHLGAFQPDVVVSCPECQHTLQCKACGFVYGGEEDREETKDEA